MSYSSTRAAIINKIKQMKEEINDVCKHCGWCNSFQESHIVYQLSVKNGCKQMNDKYDISINEDGEVEYKLKE